MTSIHTEELRQEADPITDCCATQNHPCKFVYLRHPKAVGLQCWSTSQSASPTHVIQVSGN